MFEALYSAGRIWWNSVPDIRNLTYAEFREQFLQRWCPDSVLQPNLKAYLVPYAGRGHFTVQTPQPRKTAYNPKQRKFPQSAAALVQPLKTPNDQRFCIHCQWQYHRVEECFSLHPKLLEAYHAKRLKHQIFVKKLTIATIEGKLGTLTAMLVIGVTNMKGKCYTCVRIVVHA